MMYIEHTPLEENLQYILKNHVSAGETGSILAHVRDSEEAEAATQLRLRAQAEDVACAYTRAIDSLRVGANTHAATNGSRQKANHFSIKQHRTDVQRAPVPPITNGIATVEEEEDCNYELIDIVDEEEERPEKIQTPKQQQEEEANYIEYNTTDRNLNVPQNTARREIIIEIEEESQSQAYILKEAPKKLLDKQYQLPDEEPSGQNIHYNSGRHLQQNKRIRALRPVPGAIPIESVQSVHSSLPRVIQKPRRILNGILPLIPNTYSSHSFNNYHLAEDEFNFVKSRATINGFEETVGENYYLPEFEPDNAHNSQMGIDILAKLRRFLSSGSDSTHNNREEESRKRSGNWTADVNPHPIKYRKVQNHFPKIITHALDDDDYDMTSYPRRDKPTAYAPTIAPRNPIEMTQRKSLHPAEKQKFRKSMFLPPSFTNRIVRNTSYADVEFSDDDDEPEFISNFAGASMGAGKTFTERVSKKAPQVFNVPIVREDRSAMSAKNPPPLIEARSGSILATSLIPEIDLTKRKPITYAEALRQNTQLSASGGHVLGRRPASSISSSGASTSISLGGMNMLGNIRSNLWSTNARSILAQEKETEEHERYQQLLEQVVPCLYGSSDVNNSRQLAAKTINLDGPPRRRSALLNITGNTIESNKSFPVNQGKLSRLHNNWQQPSLKRPPLSSTINLDDEDDENNDDVTFTGVVQMKQRPIQNGVPTVIIDEDEISEIIDLDEEERQLVSTCSKLREDSYGIKEKKKSHIRLPFVEPVNTLQERFKTSPHLKDDWLQALQSKWTEKKKSRLQEVNETVNVVQKLTAERRAAELEMHERLRKIQIIDPDLLVIDEFPEPVVEEEPEFIDLTSDHQARIKAAICGPPDQVLISKFNLNITRRDIHTLLGHNWLNDEVINFYMNLLTERGDKKSQSHGLPTVYAMNTFFVPRLLSAGHGGVKRWTRKVDIFSKDIIPVPVHVGGVHWCMAIIHLKNRSIKYYDSMGTPNPNVLKALEQYLQDESMDKRKQPFDTSQFEVESVRDVPRQMNGSDCGVFSCMFAEYITRNREITFSQQHMEYFRHKMILEIVQGDLLQ